MTNDTGQDDDQRRIRLAKEVIDGQIKLYGALYDKTIAYTNLLLAAGYAGVFGVWSFTRPYLTKRQSLSVASLVLASLTIFVFFEIWKGVVTGVATGRRAKAIFGDDDQEAPEAEVFIDRLRQFEVANTKDALRLSKIWPLAWGASVLLGLAGVMVLLAAFFNRLWAE